MKTITLKKVGYVIKGTSDLTDWYGHNACIEMRTFKVKQIDKKTLLANINDSGFGVQSINGAVCEIYEDFDGLLKYIKTVEVGKISSRTEEVHNERGM